MRHKGFTLIELVVVIVIIAILLSILAPCLIAARESARKVVCGHQLKQIALGITSYTLEQESYPYAHYSYPTYDLIQPPGGWVGFSGDRSDGWWWFHFVYSAVGTIDEFKQIMRCPSRDLAEQGYAENILRGNYGVNMFVCKMNQYSYYCPLPKDCEGTPLKEGISGDCLLLLDSGYSMISWQGATDQLLNKPGKGRHWNAYVPGMSINGTRIWESVWHDDAVEGRHLNRSVNTIYVDGHLESRHADELYLSEGDIAADRFGVWKP